MSLQISWAIKDKALSVRVAIPCGSVFILSVEHPVMGFFWHLSQASLKGLHYIQPLRIVEDETEAENSTPSEEKEVKSDLSASVEEGMEYYPPERCEEGVNGSYFMRDKNGRIIAVFKPTDEEGNSNNNPKRDSNERGDDVFVNSGISSGGGAIREVAAYKLDKGHFAGVPETEMATLNHPSFQSSEGVLISKTGSLQAFVENDGASWDIGPAKFPVRDVHKIGILDMRIFNNDRHGGNMLMRENFDNGNIELIPIDHGLSLSTTLDHAWFDWLLWPQAKQPFDEETKNYISNIDVEEDAETLRRMGFNEGAIGTMRISSTLLKKGSAAGLTLFEIASKVCREELDKPSPLEAMVDQAAQEACGNDLLLTLWKIMDSQIVKKE